MDNIKKVNAYPCQVVKNHATNSASLPWGAFDPVLKMETEGSSLSGDEPIESLFNRFGDFSFFMCIFRTGAMKSDVSIHLDIALVIPLVKSK